MSPAPFRFEKKSFPRCSANHLPSGSCRKWQSSKHVTAHLDTKTHICSDLAETPPKCSQHLSSLKKQCSKMVGRPPALGRPPKMGRKSENARNCLIQRENWSKVYVRFFRPKHYKGWLTGKMTNFYVVSPTLTHPCYKWPQNVIF